MTYKLLSGLAALIVLGACATATPYKAALDSDRGYSEQQIEDNRFQVKFSGNSLTERKTVETYLLYRAAELTRQSGYDHFRVVQRETDANRRVIATDLGYSPFYDNFYCDYRFFGPRAAYYRDPFRRVGDRRFRSSRFGYYDPFWGGPQEFREVTSYVATAEIIMGRGEKPDDPAYFSAEQVLFNLGGQIARPEV
jgi:hypothetical protein